MTKAWTLQQMPSQAGKWAIVTGANVGLGYQTARALARAGAQVVLACRSAERGEAAAARIRAEQPQAQVEVARLDLSSLASVGEFSAMLLERGHGVDILVNNAGIMATPERRITPDGFELQLATNYLGHFALTGRLLPLLLAAPHARVVSLSSNAHRRGGMHFEDLQLASSYTPWKAYQQTKLAMLLFARELQRQGTEHGARLVSVAAHPGLSTTSIGRDLTGPPRFIIPIVFRVLGQDDEAGALPQLYAATAATPEPIQPGGYYGPDGFGEFKGSPAPAQVSRAAADAQVGRRLWEMSEALTDVHYAWSA